MSTKYLRRSRHHAFFALCAGLVMTLLAAASVVQGLSDHPGWCIAGGCASVLFLVITILESMESLRCLRIASRWEQWDRRDLPPTH